MLQAERRVKMVMAPRMAFVLAAMLGCDGAQTQLKKEHNSSTAGKAGNVSYNFDDVPVGELPA